MTPEQKPMFRFMLQLLYDNLLHEEALLEWIADRSTEPVGSSLQLLFAQPEVQDFVSWIQEEGESEDTDEEEETESQQSA